jgi:effector-binding domain-containing protein
MTPQNDTYEVEEKTLEPVLVAGIRYKGRYDEFGDKLRPIARAMARHISGPPMFLYYDECFKESGADLETCVPVRKGEDKDDIKVHELPGGLAATLIHQGPYDTLTSSYEKISAYIKEHGYKVILPTREIYVKGPGMILRGNPDNYLTEIQMPIEP